MDAKVVNSVSLKDELKTFLEVEDLPNGVRVTLNGEKHSVHLYLDKIQAKNFFNACSLLINGK